MDILYFTGAGNKDWRKKNLKQGNLKKKAGAVALTMMMIMTSFPQTGTEAYAAENERPTTNQFATKEELKSFNTDDTNDEVINPAKVYFGQNGSGSAQKWWIAGSQNGNLTLFAASAPAKGQRFAKDSENKYSADWGCDYQSGAPEKVYANHYGASPLRDTLKSMETDDAYFTSEEQALMKNTTIYTRDAKNGSVYFTTNKLYLAYGDLEAGSITVGANSADALNGGLCIDRSYWGASSFWLRAPSGKNAMAACPGSSVQANYVQASYVISSSNKVVPAFELDLSSVIFSSAASAATSEGSLTVDENAMTLRYEDSNLGSAKVAFDQSTVNLKDVPEDTYLVAQNSAGAWAKKVSGTNSVSAGDMGSGFTGFENCRVWLETTNTAERKTYAAMAAKEWYDVNVADNETLNIALDNADQRVKIGDAVTDITVQVKDGYYLPDGYIESIQGLNGLIAAKTDTGFTISGTPQSDAVITLPDATETDAAAFTLDTSGMQTTLAAEAETAVSVKTNTDLGAGTYQANLKITGDAGVEKSVPITFTVEEHEYEHEWKFDSTGHWHECACGEKMDAAAHTEDGGNVTKAPTEEETGVRTYKCSVCGSVMRTEKMDKLPPTSTEAPGQTENPTSSEKTEDSTKRPQETVTPEKVKENSAKLDSAVSVKWKGKALALKWTKIAGAEGYDVFAAQSGKKGSKATLTKTVENGKTSVSLAKIAGKKISGKEVYSVSIKAWKHVDGKKTYIGSSRTYHTAGSANKKYTNVKKLKLAKKKHTLKKGGSVRIQATTVKQSKKKKLLPKSYGAALRYQSGNEKIATVTQKGKVTAKGKGTCYIYVAALNGVRAKIKITVK